MRPPFGIFRHVELRQSNDIPTERGSFRVHLQYPVTVTRIVIFWVTIWQHETRSLNPHRKVKSMNKEHLAICMGAICDPELSKNPVAWFDLEQYGITREALKKQVEAGRWDGPRPVFANAPDRNDALWVYMHFKAAEIDVSN